MAWRAGGVRCAIVAMLTLAIRANATTIDFESPLVTAPEGFERFDPLVIEDVSFQVTPTGPVLYREEPEAGCQDTVNQRLGGQLFVFGLQQFITIRANFPIPPAEPVTTVSVDVGSNGFDEAMTLELVLFDPNDAVLAESHMMPAAADCWLRTRATLTATSSAPVAYAVISAYHYYVDDCLAKAPWCAYEDVWIDDLTFGSTAVVVEQGTWSGLKARFH